MTRTTVLMLLLAAVAAPAIAQPTTAPTPAPTAATPEPGGPGPVARLQLPDGWLPDDGRATGMVKSLGAEPHFGGVPVGLDAQYLRSPIPGAILIASQVVTETVPADPATVAAAELHATRDGADAVTGAKVVRWELRLDPAGRVHEAQLEWTDPSVGTTVLARTLVFRTKTELARISAECILGPDAGAQRPACEAALASLAPKPVDLEPMMLSAERPTTPPPSAGLPPAPTIGERDAALPTTIMVRPAQPTRDRRPYYVIGGLVLLGLAFWWNRRDRARRDSLASAAARRTTTAADADDDADADAKPSDQDPPA